MLPFVIVESKVRQKVLLWNQKISLYWW